MCSVHRTGAWRPTIARWWLVLWRKSSEFYHREHEGHEGEICWPLENAGNTKRQSFSAPPASLREKMRHEQGAGGGSYPPICRSGDLFSLGISFAAESEGSPPLGGRGTNSPAGVSESNPVDKSMSRFCRQRTVGERQNCRNATENRMISQSGFHLSR